MKVPVLKIAILLLILSCNSDKERINGSWLIFYDDLNEESIAPMHLEFEGDSLSVSNELFFQIKESYELRNDSLHFYQTDLTGCSALIWFEEDEILSLNGKRYHKLDYSFHLPPSYKLINYPANKLYQNSKESIIHLVKFKGDAKVILNDILKEIDDVGSFVQNKRILSIAILIGEGIGMKNLTELYSHIYSVRPNSPIKLIVKNEGIDSFFYLDETMLFCDTAHCPLPYPPSPICSYYFEKRDSVASILIESEADFVKIEQIAPCTEFLINLGPELKIQTYFNLKTLLEHHPEGRIIFKRPLRPC